MSYVRDVLVVAGAGLVSYGVWMAYHPAGVVVAGVFLLGAGLAGVLRGGVK